MHAVPWLIVGLGNPGAEYAETRHNIGWMVVHAFVERYGGLWRQGVGPWMEAQVRVSGQPVIAILPLTYMNRSGEAVRALQKLNKIPTERIVIVLDELNFPLGRLHLKASGSDGGHNGMASVIEHLGTRNVLRLRCGIGDAFPTGGMVEYVLSPFDPHELPQRDAMIERAVRALEYLLKHGPARAMSVINSGKLESQPQTTSALPNQDIP
ncbi:MAG: aminoacyl-tRNA hydrolase [Candidatus Kapabacteria bacterium]|nr:aminoacyl-tRNA hydrolase [Candidatus Kapabacteria bacterium]